MQLFKRLPERIDARSPLGASPLTRTEHLAHYKLVIPWCHGKVLDAGCGVGLGVDMLRREGFDVVGIDKSIVAVGSAQSEFGPHFYRYDLRDIPETWMYDVILCMEVIEHVTLAEGIDVLRLFRRCLNPGGTLILSTPNRDNTNPWCRSPFHVFEYSPEEMRAFLRVFGFSSIEMFGLSCKRKHFAQLASSRVAQRYTAVKHRLGFNRPFPVVRSVVEFLLTGETSDSLVVDDWELIPNVETAATMVFVCRTTEAP